MADLLYLGSDRPDDPGGKEEISAEDVVYSGCWEVKNCSRSDYLACPAYQQRKNCYELDRVICCTKHRDNCGSCPVYIALNRVPVERALVHVYTDRFDAVGVVHTPKGMRLSDYLSKTTKPFLVMTDVDITPINQPAKTQRNEFVVINKTHIVLIHPTDDY